MYKFLTGTAIAFLLLAPSLSPAQAQSATSTPFGYFQLPETQSPAMAGNTTELTLQVTKKTVSDLIAMLDSARAAHMHLYIHFVDNGPRANNPDGSLSLAGYKQDMSAFCQQTASSTPNCPNLSSYVQDGTLLGFHLFEYSLDPTPAQVTEGYPTLDYMKQGAAHVKTLWPAVPMVIDSSNPCLLTKQTWSSNDVSSVLITFFTAKQDDFAAGANRFQKNIACMQQVHLGYAWIINPFGGTQQATYENNLPNYRHYLETVLLSPGAAIANLVWRYWPNTGATVTNGAKVFPNFWNEEVNPGVTETIEEIERCAKAPSAANCPSATSQAHAPTCKLSASPSTVAPGKQTTLSWTSTDATGGTWVQNSAANALGLSGDGVLANGSMAVRVDAAAGTTTPVLTVYDAYGDRASCSTSVTVTASSTPPSGPAGFITSFMASPSQVAPGGWTYLMWNTENAASCQLQSIVGGTVRSSIRADLNTGDPFDTSLTQTTTYRLACTMLDGATATKDAVVTVVP